MDVIKISIHKRYLALIAKNFPKAQHKTYKGLAASVVGMGSLKPKSTIRCLRQF